MLKTLKRLNYCQLVEGQPLLLARSLIGIKQSAWSDIHRPLVCRETGDLNSEVYTELAVMSKTGTANPHISWPNIFASGCLLFRGPTLSRVQNYNV